MPAASGMGRECKKFYSRLAKMISLKRGTGYNITAIYCSDSLEQSFSGDAYVSECFSNVFSNVWFHIIYYSTIANYKLYSDECNT